MDHLIQPLEHLLARAATFAVESRVRLLHVAADDELYDGAIRTVLSLEWSPRNRQQFVPLIPG